jgi:predicted DNA-binding protein
MNNNTPLMTIRLDIETRTNLKVLSAQERKTMAQMIKTLIESYKQQRGEK